MKKCGKDTPKRWTIDALYVATPATAQQALQSYKVTSKGSTCSAGRRLLWGVYWTMKRGAHWRPVPQSLSFVTATGIVALLWPVAIDLGVNQSLNCRSGEREDKRSMAPPLADPSPCGSWGVLKLTATFVSRTLEHSRTRRAKASLVLFVWRRTPALMTSRRGSLLRWSWCGWSCCSGCSRVTVARGPSLMASGASRCPPIPPACSGGRSGAGGGRSGVRSGWSGFLCFGL